jgi:hypothetical protein
LVLSSEFVIPVTARAEVVAFPCTSKLPVVVAPPKMVRPPMFVPEPMVDEAKAVRPPLNWVKVEVALPAAPNG